MRDVSTPLDMTTKPVVACYCATFLKTEMLHIYRQITALQRVSPVVIAQKRENADAFPFADIRVLAKPWTHPLRRLWQKQLLGRPITIYRSEARRILAALNEERAAHGAPPSCARAR